MGLGRAGAAALIFSLPMQMTMEMWWLGIYLSPVRLASFIVVSLPFLIVLARFGGFEDTRGRWMKDIVDTFVAIAVATVVAALVLAAFNVISAKESARAPAGMIAMQVVPASIGALLARSQLGDQSVHDEAKRQNGSSYLGELFVILAGALFLSLNVAPTEEMILISYKMTFWHKLVLVALSITILHTFIYSVKFRGSHQRPLGGTFFSTFMHYTLASYAVVFLVSLGVLWLFGRTDDGALQQIVSATVVLAFPAAIGAALGRLVL